MPNLNLETLKNAKTLIENGWCQGSEAKDIDGNIAHNKSRKAVSFCVVGSISRAAHDLGRSINSWQNCFNIFRKANSIISISAFNDHPSMSKEEILQAFDRAIALAETEN